jgi:hypothetical protein
MTRRTNVPNKLDSDLSFGFFIILKIVSDFGAPVKTGKVL